MKRASAGAVSHRTSGAPNCARRHNSSLRPMTSPRSPDDSSPDGELTTARHPAASCQLEHDPSAERVAEHCRRVQVEAVQFGLDRIGRAARGRSDAIGQRRTCAEAGEIDRNHIVAAPRVSSTGCQKRQLSGHRVPLLPGVSAQALGARPSTRPRESLRRVCWTSVACRRWPENKGARV
jgi:hypothetical protein